jgi:isoquinoline 1-oxidoreductase beta subunit
MNTLPHAPLHSVGLSRRSFLLSSGAATVAVAFGPAAFAQGAASSALAVNTWIRIHPDNTVTLQSPGAEMGQGTKTALPLLLAEEMDLDWTRVRVEQAAFNAKSFGNPLFGGGMLTGASRTTRGYYTVLRLAGQQARDILLLNAAKHWNVPVSELTTVPSRVLHAASGRSLSYGDIAAFAEMPDPLPTPDAARLKPASQFRLIGHDTPRVDVPDKVNGKAVYGIDVRLPGMRYATVLRAPVQGEKPEAIDDAKAKAVPGVLAIVPMPYGVGVVAESYWAARQGRDALQVTWSSSALARKYTSSRAKTEYLARAANVADAGAVFKGKVGDADAALAGAHKVVERDFASEHVAHTCMEPMNCTAVLRGEQLEIWVPTQSYSLNMGGLARLGFKPENVKLNMTLLGGGFGRRVEADIVIDGALLARALPGTPIKLVWTREDDIRHDKFRPLVAQRLSVALDAKGQIVALRHRIVGESIYGRTAPPILQGAGGFDQPVCEGAETITYGIPNRSAHFLRETRGIDVGFWRGVGPGYTKFAIEVLMDELAQMNRQDEARYRLAHLGTEPRAQAVIRTVMQMSGWDRKRPKGRALGIAYSDAWETHIAQVAEVSVDRKTGRVRVHEVWAAVDPGVAVQPRNIAAQIEGGIVFGVSAALSERVLFENGKPQTSNFHDYPVLRMDEAPRVHVKVMPSGDKPGGIGEAGLPPIAPAMANAVFKLTGKRLRELPLDAEALKA